MRVVFFLEIIWRCLESMGTRSGLFCWSSLRHCLSESHWRMDRVSITLIAMRYLNDAEWNDLVYSTAISRLAVLPLVMFLPAVNV